MSRGQAHLAIDLGAESGRAILGVLDDDRLELHELHRFANRPCRLPSGMHWDIAGLWANVVEGARRAVSWARDSGVPLVSVGVDTWGVDYGLLGPSGELLGLPHTYRDQRCAAAFEQTMQQIGAERLYAATGIQPMTFNTLFQLVAERDAEPDRLAAAVNLLFMPDLLHQFLCGETVVEATIASTSQMLDPRTGRWALGLLEELGLPTDLLGPIVAAGTPIGTLRNDVAAEIGSDDGLLVIAPAAHDTASAVAAVPAGGDESWCFLSSGTWSLLGAELDEPCLTDAARRVPFTNEGGVGGTVRFLKNITGLWLVQECRRQFNRDRDDSLSYERLTELAEAAEPFRTLIDPSHRPFAAPDRVPSKIAEFAYNTGQPVPSQPGQHVRCCLESLALTYRRTLEQLEEVLHRRFDVIHIVGGGSRNGLLNQMTADATGRPVVAGPEEATAAGNVLVQAMGAGAVSDLAHLRRIIVESFDPVRHEPRDTRSWEGAYERFTELIGHSPQRTAD